MVHRSVLALVLVCSPGFVLAQEAPERLLSAETQIYVRWDGSAAHQGAYAKSALGKSFEELQPLVAELTKLAPQHPLTELAQSCGRHGLVVGVRVQNLNPPEMTATLILPSAGRQA